MPSDHGDRRDPDFKDCEGIGKPLLSALLGQLHHDDFIRRLRSIELSQLAEASFNMVYVDGHLVVSKSDSHDFQTFGLPKRQDHARLPDFLFRVGSVLADRHPDVQREIPHDPAFRNLADHGNGLS